MNGFTSARYQCHASTLNALAWETVPNGAKKLWEQEAYSMKKNAACTQNGMEYFYSKFMNEIENIAKVNP